MLSRSNWILIWLQDNRLAVFVSYTWSGNSILPFKSQICCQYRSIFITYLSISAYHIHVHVKRVTHEQVCLRQGAHFFQACVSRFTPPPPPPPPPCAIPASFPVFIRQYFPFALQLVFATPLLALDKFSMVCHLAWLCYFL